MKAMINDYFFLSGTILPWVPKPSKGTINPVVIPKCWVECNGKQIPSGIWRGQKTPHLSGYLRHRGGVHISGSESFSTLESCMHGMGIDDESNFDETRRKAGLRPAFCSLLSLPRQGWVQGVIKSGTRWDKV